MKIVLALITALAASPVMAQNLTPYCEKAYFEQELKYQRKVESTRDGIFALTKMAFDGVDIICNHRTPGSWDPPKCVKARAARLAAVEASGLPPPPFPGLHCEAYIEQELKYQREVENTFYGIFALYKIAADAGDAEADQVS